METHVPRTAVQKTYFSHHNPELPGRSPADAASTEQAVENAIATIREILTEERRKTRRHVLPDLAPHVPVDHVAPARSKSGARRAGLVARVKGLRLKPYHAGWLVAFALVLWQPMAVLIVLFIAFWLVVIGYAVFGPERMMQLRSRGMRRAAKLWEQRHTRPRLKLRREPEPDVFADRPEPFERITLETR